MFKAYGTIKHVEEDNFKEGCNPETSQAMDIRHIVHTGETIEELKEGIMKFHSVESDNMLVGELEDDRIDVQVLEDGEGIEADKREMEEFKKGNINLYLCDYSYRIVKEESVSLVG